MDKPADPATPFAEVYQSFFDDLALEGTKPSTIHRYRYNIVRFEKWLNDNRRPATLASLEDATRRYRQHLETLPQQPRGSIRRRRGGLMSRHTVHSYLRSIKCLASWLKVAGHLEANPFLAVNAYYKKKGVCPCLQADDRIPKVGKPSDVTTLLAGCEGDRPEDLRDTALVWLLYSSGTGLPTPADLTIEATDFERGALFIEDGRGDWATARCSSSTRSAANHAVTNRKGRTSAAQAHAAAAWTGPRGRIEPPRDRCPVPVAPAGGSRRDRAHSVRLSCRSLDTPVPRGAAGRSPPSDPIACDTAWRPTWREHGLRPARDPTLGRLGPISRPCRSTPTWIPHASACRTRPQSRDPCLTSSLPKRVRRSRKVSAPRPRPHQAVTISAWTPTTLPGPSPRIAWSGSSTVCCPERNG